MKEVIINNKQYSFPEKWSEITLQTYKRIVDSAVILTDETSGNIAKTAAIAAKILDIPIKELYFTTQTEFNKIIELLVFLNDEIDASSKKNSVEINDVVYSIKADLEKLTVGEMVSFEIATQNSNRLVDLIAPSLALLLRREKNEFDADNYFSFIQQIEENVDVETATAMSAFFLSGENIYMKKFLQTYLRETETAEIVAN